MRGVFDIRAFEFQKPPLSIAGSRLAHPKTSPRRTTQVEIGSLAFRCPTTQREIESGIELDRCTFEKIKQFIVRVHCTACGYCHEFKVASGSLVAYPPIRRALESQNCGVVSSPSIASTTVLQRNHE